MIYTDEKSKDKSTANKATEVKGSQGPMTGPYGPTSGINRATPKPAAGKSATGGGMHPGGGAYKPPVSSTPKPKSAVSVVFILSRLNYPNYFFQNTTETELKQTSAWTWEHPLGISPPHVIQCKQKINQAVST